MNVKVYDKDAEEHTVLLDREDYGGRSPACRYARRCAWEGRCLYGQGGFEHIACHRVKVGSWREAEQVFNGMGVKVVNPPRNGVTLYKQTPPLVQTGPSRYCACSWAITCPTENGETIAYPTDNGETVNCLRCPAHKESQRLTAEEAVAWWKEAELTTGD